MSFKEKSRRPALAFVSIAALAASPALAGDDADQASTIVVTARRPAETIENVPMPGVSIAADRIAATVNAVNVEDSFKYLPSLIVRKRHIGDTQAPLATRTSGLGASARSLVYADGALLSALIGNNNTTASPRWGLVSPQEVARIDILYGPYSAAYPGNSIGAVVNITTRMPERFEGTISAGTHVQHFRLYGTRATLPAGQVGATIGDRFGPLALFASFSHVDSRSHPLTIVSAARPAAGTPTGGFDAVNRTNMPISVLGASGIEHQRQDNLKLKAVLDLGDDVRLIYVGGLFRNGTDARAETYLRDALTGTPVFTPAFSSGEYRRDERHWSHALSAERKGERFDWQVIGTVFRFGRDILRIPTTALPAARSGGAGTITNLHGTGWATFDAKGAWRADGDRHIFSFGAHHDRFRLASHRFVTADWLTGGNGALNLASRGKTRTRALWAQDAWKIAAPLTLTIGGRQEWWKAYGGVNISTVPAISVVQPRLSAKRFSPKASLAWTAAADWTARLSFGQAWRFPTVAELYQIVTTPVPAVPNPNLSPERARSAELAIEHRDARGTVRLSLFHEDIKDALVSQSGPVNAGAAIATFVQNVDRTRARGVELAVQRSDVLPRVDLSGSVTRADARTRRNPVLPASEGKLIPGVPRWKATIVGTWRPTGRLSLTAAARAASRIYGTIDNSDIVGNTYQGFHKYLVVDLRAQVKLDEHLTLGLGVDNVANDRYFLFHPFPQRSFAADIQFRF